VCIELAGISVDNLAEDGDDFFSRVLHYT